MALDCVKEEEKMRTVEFGVINQKEHLHMKLSFITAVSYVSLPFHCQGVKVKLKLMLHCSSVSKHYNLADEKMPISRIESGKCELK